jgi:hypothetical protein
MPLVLPHLQWTVPEPGTRGTTEVVLRTNRVQKSIYFDHLLTDINHQKLFAALADTPYGTSFRFNADQAPNTGQLAPRLDAWECFLGLCRAVFRHNEKERHNTLHHSSRVNALFSITGQQPNQRR